MSRLWILREELSIFFCGHPVDLQAQAINSATLKGESQVANTWKVHHSRNWAVSAKKIRQKLTEIDELGMTAQYAVWKKVADFPQFRRNSPHPAKLDAERWTVAWTTKTIVRNFYTLWESNIARKSPTVDEQNPANHLECQKKYCTW